jgi:hypothetical protein
MKSAALFLLLLGLSATAKAVTDPIGAPEAPVMTSTESSVSADLTPSTTPIGSSYYRHLAYDFDIPIKELVKFERKGFGRIEIVEIILIANSMEKSPKDLGNRRIKDHVSMETLAKEAGLNYQELAKVAREIKTEIESRGDKDLPAASYDVGTSSAIAAAAQPKKVKKVKQQKEEEKKL